MPDAGFRADVDSDKIQVEASEGYRIMAVPDGIGAGVFRHVLSASYAAYLGLGRQPDLEEVHEYWPRIDPKTYAIVWMTDEFREAMIVRGIEWDTEGGLSYEQSLTIDKLSNALDKRSDDSKLREIGVTSVQYAAWRKNPLFMRILEQRATANIKEHVPAILNRMVGKAEAGNIQAADRILALDGRFDPQNREAQNLREFLRAFSQIVNMRVEDPEVRKQIAADLAGFGAGTAMIEASKQSSI